MRSIALLHMLMWPAGAGASRSLMAEPMTLDTLKLASTVGLGGWLATLQRHTSQVRALTAGLVQLLRLNIAMRVRSCSGCFCGWGR